MPTPVGPRNRNEPIGRLGSCRPARARRTALLTAATASSWPTTRECSFASICSSLSRSPSSIRSTGTPVQRETTWAMSLSVTASWTMSSALARLGLGELALELRDLAVGDLAGAREVALALRHRELLARTGRAAP